MRLFAVAAILLSVTTAEAGAPSRRDILRQIVRTALTASPVGRFGAAAASGVLGTAAPSPVPRLPEDLEFEAMFLAAFDFEGQRRLTGRIRTTAGIFAQIHRSVVLLRSYGRPLPPNVETILKRTHGQLGELYRSWTKPTTEPAPPEPIPEATTQPTVAADVALTVLFWAMAEEGLNPYLPLTDATIPQWIDLLERWDSALDDLGYDSEKFSEALDGRHHPRWDVVRQVQSECVARILAKP